MGWRSPFTVFGFVIPIAVETVDRHPFGTFSHIGEEIGEDMPACTDFDSLAAVVLPAVVGGPIAAVQHRTPTFEGWRNGSDSGVAVLEIAGGCELAACTAATRRHATSQFVSADERLDAAIAGADPLGVSVFANVRESDGNQSAKTLTRDINARRHGDLLRRLSCLGTAQPSTATSSRCHTTEGCRGRA